MIGRLLIACVRAYQVILSPHIGRCCRFEPSCSEYVVQAIRIHGPGKGLWLGVRRIIRCRPFGPAGCDPVPPRTE
jgi:putative membrane protein insertion efficiency factor